MAPIGFSRRETEVGVETTLNTGSSTRQSEMENRVGFRGFGQVLELGQFMFYDREPLPNRSHVNFHDLYIGFT